MSNKRRLSDLLIQLLSKRGPTRWLTVLLIVVGVGVLIARPELLRDDLTSVGTINTHADSKGAEANPGASTSIDGPSARSNSASSGQLKELPGDVLVSPAGLQYTRGSQQGHRIKHVMVHARDEPNRPGQHGVFTVGGRDEIVALLDEAYVMSQQNSPNVRSKSDRDRTVLTVDMGRQIGYVGGQSGNRRGQPSARHLRIVLEGNRVITAYPFVP